MQFYRFQGTPEGQIIKSNYLDREEAGVYADRAETFNETVKGKAFFFISRLTNTECVIGVIANGKLDVDKTVRKFLKTLKITVTDESISEITFSKLDKMLNMADNHNWIDSRDEVLDMFDINDMLELFRCGFDLEEDVLADSDKGTVYKKASSLISSETLTAELDRIHTPGRSKKTTGIPVQYMVITDDSTERETAITSLIQSLYANGRVSSKRCCRIRFLQGRGFNWSTCRGWFENCEGGTVVVRFSGVGSTDGDIANGDMQTIEALCEIAKRYISKVQMIFCFPRECSKAKDMFYSNIGAGSFVEIQESLAYGERAKEYLNMLAGDSGLRPDKKLYSRLEKNEGYLAKDLRAIFADWYADKMKNVVYPQYKDIASCKSLIKDKKPNGSAYGDLQELVGLPEAKTVIEQALDYYKAQKLFADRGVSVDHPAMHMVFTGNPGTAKTTVARLFAQIMRENGLLSRGHLVECGRGDLVGKYVGWTAPTVQKKFAEAEGGVLFIDEAYSLVDDRSGSYGDEAINTIVQEMENHREDMVVIFAGYPDKMEGFLNTNPGLRSRIAFHVPFADYDTESLCKIAEHIAAGKGLKISAEALDKLAGVFETARKQEDFGNGRFARNLIEKARMAQMSRLVKMDYKAIRDSDLKMIVPEDIVVPAEVKKIKTWGFCA